MILSMTGYGTGSAQKDNTVVSVEIKTVNHRFLDFHARVSREYQFLEGEVQQLIRSALDRGRVDVNVTIQNAVTDAFEINSNLLTGYMKAADKLKEDFHFQDSLDLKTILSLPGIVQVKEAAQTEPSGTLSELVAASVREALGGVLRMRRQEGEALRADMQKNLAGVEENAGRIRELSVNLASEYLDKLRERLNQLLSQAEMDPQRLAQEAALIADKSDISEEIARLTSHIEQYRFLMDAQEKAGKKLDFLLQELQREANTILSKSGDLEISRCAIAIKTDIEKLREQVQNVE
ncbi:MAG TPA: YicC/YloC family endoribonuclease [Acidobacteriota bacterium]|nr:YicC/YloC family endoribonuclease [Acidobacteriota bacterium]